MGGGCDAIESASLRSMLADRDPLARRVIRDTLQQAGIVVVAEAGSGQEAIELAMYYRPDVVVMEYRMRGMDGIEATRRLHAYDRSIRVVMLAVEPGEDLPLRALAAGAVGFISKDVELDALPRVLWGVRDGQAAISRELTLALIEHYRTSTNGHGMRPVHSGLTDREWQVLDLLATGATTEELAAKLVLSIETVRSHLKRVYRKLGVRSRDAAVLAADRLRSGEASVAAPLSVPVAQGIPASPHATRLDTPDESTRQPAGRAPRAA